MDASSNTPSNFLHNENSSMRDENGGGFNAPNNLRDADPSNLTSELPNQITDEEANADDEESDGEPDSIPIPSLPASDREAQEPTGSWDHREVPALQAAWPQQRRRLTDPRRNARLDNNESDEPPGLAYVSGSSDLDEELEGSSDDDQMPDLQPIGFYDPTRQLNSPERRSAGTNGPSLAEGAGPQSNTEPNDVTQNGGMGDAVPRNAHRSLTARPVDRPSPRATVNNSIRPEELATVVLEEIYQSLRGLNDDTATPANRAREIVKRMHVLDKEELRRYQNLAMLQADNEEDRSRGASCSVCWEALILSEEDGGGQLEDGKGKGKEQTSSSTAEPGPSTSSAPSGITDSEDENRIVALPCTHVFHSKCLIPWFVRSATCPECRFDLDPSRRIPRTGTIFVPRLWMSRDIYDLQNRTRRNGDQTALSATTSARRARSLPRQGGDEQVVGNALSERLQSEVNTGAQDPDRPTMQQTDLNNSRETQESVAAAQPEVSVVGTANEREAPDTTSIEDVPGDVGGNPGGASLDVYLHSNAPQERNASGAPNLGTSNAVGPDRPRPIAPHTVVPRDNGPQDAARISERLSGIRESLSGVNDRLRGVENRLESVEVRLRGMGGRMAGRSNALDSTRALSSRQDLGMSEVGSREEAIRRLRSMAAEGSSATRSQPASVNSPGGSIQTASRGQLLSSSSSLLRNENNANPTVQASQPRPPATSSGAAMLEDASTPAESHEPAFTAAVVDALVEQNHRVMAERARDFHSTSHQMVEMATSLAGVVDDRARRELAAQSIRQRDPIINQAPLHNESQAVPNEAAEGDHLASNSMQREGPSVVPSQGEQSTDTSIPAEEYSQLDQSGSTASNTSTSRTETEAEEVARLEQEIRQLENELGSDQEFVEIGETALRQLGGMMNTLSQALREAARQEQAFSQAIDTLQAQTQGHLAGLNITNSDTPQADPMPLGAATGVLEVYVPGDTAGGPPLGPSLEQGTHQRPNDTRGYVPPPGKMTFEEMLVSREKEQGLRCPGICGRLLEEGGCSCAAAEKSGRIGKSE